MLPVQPLSESALAAVDAVSRAQLEQACGTKPGLLCRTVLNLTHSEWAAQGANVLLAKPAKILLIVVLAFVIRTVAHRAIDRLVRRAAAGTVPVRLRTLRDKAPTALLEAAPLTSERRAQRTETVGSVLRSIASALVFG